MDLGSQKVFLKKDVLKTIEKPVIQLQITKKPTPYHPYIECEVTRSISEVITTEKSYQQIKKKKISTARYKTEFHLLLWTIGWIALAAPLWAYYFHYRRLESAAEKFINSPPGEYRDKVLTGMHEKIVTVSFKEYKGEIEKNQSTEVSLIETQKAPVVDANILAQILEHTSTIQYITDSKGKCSIPIANPLIKLLSSQDNDDIFPITIRLNVLTEDGEDFQQLALSKKEVLAITSRVGVNTTEQVLWPALIEKPGEPADNDVPEYRPKPKRAKTQLFDD